MAMTLRSDADGFIKGGEPVKDLKRGGSRSREEALLYRIDTKVEAIRKAVVAGVSTSSRRSAREEVATPFSRSGSSRPVMPSTTSTRASGAEFPTGTASLVVATPNGKKRSERAQAASALPAVSAHRAIAASTAPVKPGGRDGKGRFVRKQGGEGSKDPQEMPSDKDSRGLKGLGDRIAGALNGAGSMEEADPAVKAFSEIAQPLARGYFKLAGGDKDERQKTGWFRKIFGELRMFRAEETGYAKAAGKSLKALEEKPEAGGAESGNGGILRTALNGIKGALPAVAMVLGSLVAAMAPLLAMLKVTQWAADTTHDEERVDALNEGAAKPAKEALQTVGIDSDKRVEERRADTLEKRDGEYSKEQAARAAFKPAGLKPGSREFEDAFYRDQQAKDAAAAEQAKKNPVRRGWEAAKGWVLGQTSKIFESGKGGAGTVSTGKGDHGGASYGTYQLSSAKGRVQEFLKDSKYGAQFEGLKPGSPEFNAKWKEVAKNDPAFGDEQHDFIKRTHYDLAMKSLKRSGINLSGKGAAVQDSLWSTSVHLGPEGAASAFKKATKGRDVSQMTDADIVTAVQDYKLANNDRLFAKSSPAVRAGTASRAVAEKSRLLALANSAQAPVMASMPMTPTVRAPSIPTAADAPPVVVPLTSGSKPQPVIVAQAPADVGQDLRDRRIAHIATGGVSN